MAEIFFGVFPDGADNRSVCSCGTEYSSRAYGIAAFYHVCNSAEAQIRVEVYAFAGGDNCVATHGNVAYVFGVDYGWAGENSMECGVAVGRCV